MSGLPQAPTQYSFQDQSNLRSELDKRDRFAVKQGGDHEVGAGRIILKSPDGNRWILTVDNSGTLGATAL